MSAPGREESAPWRARLFPHFDPAWVIDEDEDRLVLQKPDGVPVQAADPELPDDVITRLRAAGRGDYFGVHQRLDRDTSGVLVLAKRREANASLARAFEGRTVEKRYVAGVSGWSHGSRERVLRGPIGRDEEGRARVVAPGTPAAKGAQTACTRVRLLEQRGERALVEVWLETGRMHQARVHLAHARAPIGGDGEYGGAPASRLMLHAASLTLPGDATSGTREARYEAPLPPELRAWLEGGERVDDLSIYDDPPRLARALARALRRRYALGHAAQGERATSAFRVVNEEGDALPGLAVDLYDGALVAQLYGGRVQGDAEGRDLWDDDARRGRVLDALAALGARAVYLKVRPKQANTLVDTRRDDLAPAEPRRGETMADPLRVTEEGVPYLVRLGDGLSTGIFLDQRENRRRVRALGAGGSVVNLFAYTCAFSVAAARGGAWRTISVDASVAALARGRENLDVAEVLDAAEHQFLAEDAFTWLARAKARRDRHDLVIVDPPSYSTTKKRRFVGDRDYAELAAACFAVLRPGGRLLACSNHRGVTAAKFRRDLFEGARRAGVKIAQLKDLPDPTDYPHPAGGASHLKSMLATLER